MAEKLKIAPKRLEVLKKCAAQGGLDPTGPEWRAIGWLVDRGLLDFQTRITLRGAVCLVVEEWWITPGWSRGAGGGQWLRS